jgi:hypothetical protein
MTSQLSIVEKMNTLPNETIHTTFGCTVHLHGYWNKMMPFMKPFTLAYFNNDVKFRNRIC